MIALASTWLGLAVAVLAVVMVFFGPAFNDVLVPVALYGAVGAIGCGGLVLMRRTQPGDIAEAASAQRVQAKVGIALGMAAVLIVYGLMAAARPIEGAARP